MEAKEPDGKFCFVLQKCFFCYFELNNTNFNRNSFYKAHQLTQLLF